MPGEVVRAWSFLSPNKMIILLLLLNDWCDLTLAKNVQQVMSGNQVFLQTQQEYKIYIIDSLGIALVLPCSD